MQHQISPCDGFNDCVLFIPWLVYQSHLDGDQETYLFNEDIIECIDVIFRKLDDGTQVLLVVLEQRLVDPDEDLASPPAIR
jgi:hypothetical protein